MSNDVLILPVLVYIYIIAFLITTAFSPSFFYTLKEEFFLQPNFIFYVNCEK